MIKRTGRCLGTLTLAAALVAASVQPVMAKSTEPSAFLQESKKELPGVRMDRVTWEGGKLEIPLSLGGYTADELIVILSEPGVSDKLLEIQGDKGVCSLVSYSDIDGDEWYAKAGDYARKVVFKLKDGKVLAEADLTIHVPKDSQKWQVTEVTKVFDGTQDVTFEFQNGTNCFALQTINKLNIYTGSPSDGGVHVDVPDMTEGFTCDMAEGTLTIQKDALKKALAEGESQSGGKLPEKIAVNAQAVTLYGEEFNFNRVPVADQPTISNTAWWLDISKLDLEEGENPVPEGPSAEFDENLESELMVSADDAQIISKSALEFVQKNFADQLADLGEEYTVVSYLALTERKEAELDQQIKDAFAGAAEDSIIGKYYEIQVLADVVADDQKVEGLTGIKVPAVSSEVSMRVMLPQELWKEGRIFTMLHYEDGKAAALQTEANAKEVSFRTKSFSPYALAYKDVVEENGNGEKPAVQNQRPVPKTGDSSMPGAAGAAILAAAVAAGVCIRKRK